MKLPIRKHLPIAAGLLILSAIIAYQQYQLSTLSRTVNGAAEKVSIDALQNRVSAIDSILCQANPWSRWKISVSANRRSRAGSMLFKPLQSKPTKLQQKSLAHPRLRAISWY